MSDEELLADLRSEPSGRVYACAACVALAAIEDETVREALREALSGTLSERALIRVSQKHGLGIGRASIRRHRAEGHL